MWFSSCRMSYSSVFSCGLILAIWSLMLIYLVFLCTTTLGIAVSYRQIKWFPPHLIGYSKHWNLRCLSFLLCKMGWSPRSASCREVSPGHSLSVLKMLTFFSISRVVQASEVYVLDISNLLVNSIGTWCMVFWNFFLASIAVEGGLLFGCLKINWKTLVIIWKKFSKVPCGRNIWKCVCFGGGVWVWGYICS